MSISYAFEGLDFDGTMYLLSPKACEADRIRMGSQRRCQNQATHHDVLLLIHLTALEDVLAFLHFYVHSFESQLLAVLLQGVVGKDLVHEGVDQMVESPVALPMQKLPFEHMMPSKSQLTAN
jgi:hypothetical protein